MEFVRKVLIAFSLSILIFSSAAIANQMQSSPQKNQITKNLKTDKKNYQEKNKKRKDKKDKKNTKDKDDKKKDDSPPEIGNFALPSSQQPGALMSFGQNIIEKNNKQIFLLIDYFNTQEGYYTDIAPNFVYAFSDYSSIFLYVPFAKYKQAVDCTSSGIEDTTVQFEYAFYSKSNKKFMQTGTLVASVILPSGSYEKCPSTGAGGISYFVGGTINRMYTDWYVFFSPGINLISSNNGSRSGNRYYYQAGIGKNICAVKSKYIFNWLIEVDGIYSEHDRFHTLLDPNSGGNIVYVTPSLWLSTKRWIFQLGVGSVVTQHLSGDQLRNRYLFITDIGYTF